MSPISARVDAITTLDEGVKLRIATAYDPKGIDIGASIACAGVCLTVTTLPEEGSNGRWFEVEAWEEALRLTTHRAWTAGHPHQSRAVAEDRRRTRRPSRLRPCRRHGGNRRASRPKARRSAFALRAPRDLASFVAPKGSVALDGTSLTVNAVDGAEFDVLLIRHSLEVTTWGERQAGDLVNFEVDTMARYAARLAEASVASDA